MKKNYFLFVFLVFTVICVSAKKADDVSAIVKDSQTKQPIAFASVELLSTKDSLLTGCITDSKGYFEITPTKQTAKVRIRYVGYKNFEAPLKTNDLGTVFLIEDAKLLKEVTVNGSALVNKVDRDIFVITKNLRSGTISSQELLGKLNGVTYNYYDKSISVNGSTKVLILVDGVEKDQEFAKNISPERVERVEVIKDPTGLYATEGYTAVINIIVKKDYSGIEATVSDRTFLDYSGTNGKDVLTQNISNITINYSYKKLNIYSSGLLYNSNFNLGSEFDKRYGNAKSVSSVIDYKNPNVKVSPANNNFVLGADYAFATNHTLTAELKYNKNYSTNSTRFDMVNFLNDIITGNSSSQSVTTNSTTNLSSAISYKYKIDEKNTVDANVRYVRTYGYNFNQFKQDNFESLTNIDLSGDYIRTNLNYLHNFSSKLNVELGYGNVYFSSSNTLNNNIFTRYNYRNRFSIYMSYRPFEKLNTKIGGIVESYTQSFSGTSKNQTAFLPYINIQFTPSQKFNIVAKYQSRADYPTIDQMNPYKMAQDSLLYSAGNPALKIGNNQTIGLDFNVMNFIILSPYYTFNNSQIANYIKADPENNQHFLNQTINADKFENYGVKLDLTIPFGKNIFWKNNISWYESRIRYKDESNSVNNWRINSNLIYMEQNKGILAGLVLQKQLRRDVNIQGYNTNDNDLLLVMLRKSFLNQKLNVGMYYILPVDLGLSYNLINTTHTQSYYQFSRSNMNFIKNLVFFELSYNFSTGKKVKKNQSSSDSELDQNQKSGLGL